MGAAVLRTDPREKVEPGTPVLEMLSYVRREMMVGWPGMAMDKVRRGGFSWICRWLWLSLLKDQTRM